MKDLKDFAREMVKEGLGMPISYGAGGGVVPGGGRGLGVAKASMGTQAPGRVMGRGVQPKNTRILNSQSQRTY